MKLAKTLTVAYGLMGVSLLMALVLDRPSTAYVGLLIASGYLTVQLNRLFGVCVSILTDAIHVSGCRTVSEYEARVRQYYADRGERSLNQSGPTVH